MQIYADFLIPLDLIVLQNYDLRKSAKFISAHLRGKPERIPTQKGSMYSFL